MTNWRQLEKSSQQHFSTLLFLSLIGLTGFLVGSQYRTADIIPTEAQTTTASTTENPVITELQNALNGSPSSTASTTTDDVVSVTGLVSINTGTAGELDTLPGIGPSYAKAIIDYREKNGPFVRLEDIQQVKGIGPKTFEKLKDKITL